MNLHLMYDEKVISRTIKYFEEALPNDNKYVVLINHSHGGKRLVDLDLPNLIYTSYGTDAFWDFIGDTNQYKYVILHYLGDELVDFTCSVPQTDSFVWLVWGGDLYNRLLSPFGFKLYAFTDFLDKGRLGTVLPCVYRYRERRAIRKRIEAVKKIPNLALFNGDLYALKKYFPKLQVNRKEFFYYPVDDMVDATLLNQQFVSNHIFVGNSASLTNNHRMVFKMLSKCELGKRKVITPLSYGPELGKEVALKWGKKLIKNNFYPLTDFLPLEDYNRLMLSASIFIFGSYRQEAVGNILVALYLGGIVVLSPRNPFMRDLAEMGFTVFTLNHIKELLKYHLPDEVKQKNRELVVKWFSRKRLLQVIQSSFG